MKNKYKILHYFSMINTFFLCFAIMYFILKYTVGLVLQNFIRDIYCEIIYISTDILFIKKCCKISSPYKKYID